MARPTNEERAERTKTAQQILAQLASQKRDRTDPDFSKIAPPEKGDNAAHMTVEDAIHGVSVSWMAQVFGMDPATVKKRLKDCPPLHRRKSGFVYDLKIAAQYLVTPKIDIDAYMRTMKSTDLPPHLNDNYWSAMRKKQQWELEARDLWPTASVVEVFGDVWMSIKFAIQLWPDEVEQAHGLSPEQRETLIRMGDALQAEIHRKLVEDMAGKVTPSQLHQAKVASGPNFADVENVEIDDDYSHLI